jgi:hypothetical protein
MNTFLALAPYFLISSTEAGNSRIPSWSTADDFGIQTHFGCGFGLECPWIATCVVDT